MRKTLTRALIVLIIFACHKPACAQTPVNNIVLVHGAFADGSGYEALYQLLKKRGFHVSVVANPNTGFADDVAAVKRTLDRQNGPVLLVGHSYGGAIITEAGNDPRVVGLVYIAAFAPDANETLQQLSQSSPPAPHSGILPPDQSGFLWYDPAKFHAGFCADLPADKAAFMADSQVPIAASCFGASIAAPAWKNKKSWYIVATQDQTIPPDAERFMGKRAGATITEISGSHAVFASQPAAVAAVIEAAIKGVSK